MKSLSLHSTRTLPRRPLWEPAMPLGRPLRVLLVGPYDPHCGEYTFLAPPLGVWRLCAYVRSLGHEVDVFDPNCCEGAPGTKLAELLAERRHDMVGISTTGMTLRYDLALTHIARDQAPDALLIAGGMEATFAPQTLFDLAPLDLVVLGEGEKPLRELCARIVAGQPLVGIEGTAVPLNTGGVQRFHGQAMTHDEHRDAITLTPYAEMPYAKYWRRLEAAYGVHALPAKAEREARLSEIRSVRINTLNYCPMACTFCSSTNFLHSAQGSVAKIARLAAEDCIAMVERVVAAQPHVETIIFQDDIFVFTKDQRIFALCEAIIEGKRVGRIPPRLQFISTNRIDAMTEPRLAVMKRAGFRVLGFGVESFSKRVLEEFNKGGIHQHIEPVLTTALGLGLTPFLDLILSSPRSKIDDIAVVVRDAHRWMLAGCEVGLYPYVIPFSGSKMAEDPALEPYKEFTEQTIPGVGSSWRQATHIRPIDPLARRVMEEITERYEIASERLERESPHTPSRVRSMLWISVALPVLRSAGAAVPASDLLSERLDAALGIETLGPVAASVA